MHQGLPSQIEVDESRHHPDLSAAQPEANVLQSVLHEESHAVSVLEAGREEEVCQLVAVLVKLQNTTFEFECNLS